MALPCDGFVVNEFVDREDELSKLVKMVSFSVNEEVKLPDFQRVKHLVGKSNVGKSSLLCKFHNNDIGLENVHSIFLSFKDYYQIVGEEFIVNVLDTLCAAVDRLLERQHINRLRKKPNELTFELSATLEVLIKRRGVVAFLLDEVNMLSPDQTTLLEDYFLSKILPLKDVVVVLAGRHLVTGWKDFALRPYKKGDKENVIELSGFGFEFSQKQIQTINPQIENLIPEIHEVSGGSPGNNKKIVEQLGDPPHFDELAAIQACNQEFYDALSDVSMVLSESISSEILPVLEALCVLEDFEKENEMPRMLSVHPDLSGTWTIPRCRDFLNNVLSKIQIGPGRLVNWDMDKSALVIEEQTRFNLEKELKIRNVALWKSLHCTAMKMYDEWVKVYGADSIFADKAENHKRILQNAGVNPEETCK